MTDVFPAAVDDLGDWPVVDDMIATLFGTDA
jgi:hypothetical protein